MKAPLLMFKRSGEFVSVWKDADAIKKVYPCLKKGRIIKCAERQIPHYKDFVFLYKLEF